MTWRLVLSDYPSAILRDELGVLILAVLESGGALSEDELKGSLPSAAAKVSEKLVALHADRLVEYSRNRLRVSDRGRVVLDRFSLDQDVVTTHLRCFDLAAPLKHRLSLAISNYRTHSFDRYLNSVSAARSWFMFCFVDGDHGKLPPEAAGSGSLAIWLSDLSAWANEDPATDDTASLLEKSFKLEENATPHHAFALQLMSAFRRVESEPQPWRTLASMDEPVTAFFSYYLTSRRRLEPHLFLDEWAPGGAASLACHAPLQLGDNLRTLSDHAFRHWNLDTTITGLQVRHGVVERELDLRRRLRGLLIDLLTAETIGDLSESAGFEPEQLKLLLLQIRDKCDQLTRAPNSDHAQEDPRSPIREPPLSEPS